ncbi:transposase [Bradyrhizobium sp. USDA 3315]
MIEAAGARLLYLPPYRPDFNPIENAFAKPAAVAAALNVIFSHYTASTAAIRWRSRKFGGRFCGLQGLKLARRLIAVRRPGRE